MNCQFLDVKPVAKLVNKFAHNKFVPLNLQHVFKKFNYEVNKLAEISCGTLSIIHDNLKSSINYLIIHNSPQSC